MCNLSAGIREEGILIGTENGIKIGTENGIKKGTENGKVQSYLLLIRSGCMDPEKAKSILGITDEMLERYNREAKIIQQS